MKKQTGRRSAIIRQLGAVFLLSIALYSFSTTGTESDKIPPLKSISKSEVKAQIVTKQSPLGNTRTKHSDLSPTPSEFILEMKDQDAVFFYNDHSISPDDAVLLVQHSLKIDLVAMHTGLENPIVKLSNAEMPAEYQEIILLYH